MSTAGQTLVHLDGVTKVFFTDEVETHALADIHLHIRPGEYIAIAGPSGCGMGWSRGGLAGDLQRMVRVNGSALDAHLVGVVEALHV